MNETPNSWTHGRPELIFLGAQNSGPRSAADCVERCHGMPIRARKHAGSAFREAFDAAVMSVVTPQYRYRYRYLRQAGLTRGRIQCRSHQTLHVVIPATQICRLLTFDRSLGSLRDIGMPLSILAITISVSLDETPPMCPLAAACSVGHRPGWVTCPWMLHLVRHMHFSCCLMS